MTEFKIQLGFYEAQGLEKFEEYLKYKQGEAGTAGIPEVKREDVKLVNGTPGIRFIIYFHDCMDCYNFGYDWAWLQAKALK